MGEFFKAELKDRFLKYALERNDYFEVHTLYNEFLRPNYSLDFVQKLIKEIQEYDANLLDIMGGNGVEIFMLASTPSTQQFLDAGGFKDMYLKEEEKWDTFLNQLAPKSTTGASKKKASAKHKRERTLLVILLTAVAISFAFTLSNIIYSLFLKPEYVPADTFQREMEQLRSQHLQETKKLQSELEKTQRVIDSLKAG